MPLYIPIPLLFQVLCLAFPLSNDLFSTTFKQIDQVSECLSHCQLSHSVITLQEYVIVVIPELIHKLPFLVSELVMRVSLLESVGVDLFQYGLSHLHVDIPADIKFPGQYRIQSLSVIFECLIH